MYIYFSFPSDRLQKSNDSTDSKGSSRQNRRNNNNSGETPVPNSNRRAKRNVDSGDKTAHEKRGSIPKVKSILTAEKPDDLNDKHEKQICSETFGYGADFPDSFLEEPKTIEIKVEPPNKVVSSFFFEESVFEGSLRISSGVPDSG